MNTLYFGSTQIGLTPRVVAVIGGDDCECTDLAQAATDSGADIFELRADQCHEDSGRMIALLKRLRNVAPSVPQLLTIRRLSEGGYFLGDENQRLELFQELIPHVDAVDIELYASEIRDEVIAISRTHQKPVITSYHNFKRTPPTEKSAKELTSFEEILDDAKTLAADMLKIAVHAESYEDVKALLLFTMNFRRDIHLTTISMGDKGKISRILFPFVGSCLTYGYVGDFITAAGQIPVQDLRRLLDMFSGEEMESTKAESILELAQQRGW